MQQEARKLRVAVLTSSFPRYQGDLFGSFVLGLSRALVRSSVEVEVVCPHGEKTPGRDELGGMLVQRFSYMFPRRLQTLCYGAGIPANIKERPYRALQVPSLIGGFVRAGAGAARRSDVIHAHWAFAGMAALLLGRIYRKPVVLHMHGAEAYTRLGAPLMRLVVGRADHVICNSMSTQAAVLRLAKPKAVSVIPFGVNEEKFGESSQRSQWLCQRLGLDPDVFVVSFLGRLVVRKGVDDAIRALSILNRQGYRVHLAIGGTGPQRDEWAGLAAELGMSAHVTFLGFVPERDVPHFYAGSDVFVLPAIVDASGDTEGLGVVILEAMANGVPTVASSVGGIKDVVVEEETGFLVAPGSPGHLAEKIGLLLRDSSLRNAMGRAARERVAKDFDWDSVVKRTLEVYERLSLDGRRQGQAVRPSR
jgi:glycosyltransferase involved in cell wall biosynthesis